ncbi:hypothetical protein BDR22DRAFT_822193 [Usnea florida]
MCYMNSASPIADMVRGNRSQNGHTHTTTLPIRPRAPSPQAPTTPPTTGNFVSIHNDRCPNPSRSSSLPRQHHSPRGSKSPSKSPSTEEYRSASAATRQKWTESQRRRIAENEALLRQLAGITPEVGNSSIKTHLPRGNDLTVEEQIAIIHESVAPEYYATTRDTLSERRREETTNNMAQISNVHSSTAQNKAASQPSNFEWDDFPEPNTKYSHPHNPPPFPSHNSTTTPLTTAPPCTGPCPIQTPHNQGAYLQQGQVPRVWNARWGYSDPPRRIWDAWVRVEQGRGSSWDEVEVDGFGVCHWWGGGE